MSAYPSLDRVIQDSLWINVEEVNDRELVKELQILLNAKGFNAGIVDGIVGRNTLTALEKAKNRLSLQYPNIIGRTTLLRLLALSPIQSIVHPTKGKGILTSPFGWRIHPIRKTRTFHRGIDIGAPLGTPIYAVNDGTVILIVSNCTVGSFSCGGGFGNTIRLSHEANSYDETVYAHLQSVLVRPNQLVLRGDQIGTMGTTGSSTGSHLHFEVHKNGVAFNPEDILT